MKLHIQVLNLSHTSATFGKSFAQPANHKKDTHTYVINLSRVIHVEDH